MRDGSPTCVILTFDKDLTHGNCKLFLNGKLEDQSGKVDSSGTTKRWKRAKDLDLKKGSSELWKFGDGAVTLNYDGKFEEFVYYPHVIYPVNPADGSFVWTKPMADIDSDGNSISYFARLFVKDYHNIRGTSRKEVAMSKALTVHKAGVAL